MANTKDDTRSLLPPMKCGSTLPKDPERRLRQTLEPLQAVMALTGYVPLGYISIAAFRDLLEHAASTDPVGDISDWKVLFALEHLLIGGKDGRVGGLDALFDALHDELLRVAPFVLKVTAGEMDPEDRFREMDEEAREIQEAMEAGRMPEQ